jgi:hypothetical protein
MPWSFRPLLVTAATETPTVAAEWNSPRIRIRADASTQSTIVATHGDRSSAPIEGRMRRNSRRYGSDTS